MIEDNSGPSFNFKEWYEGLTKEQQFIADIGSLKALAHPDVRNRMNEGNIDPLTGLLNRRGFERHLKEVIRDHPHPEYLALVAIDLDDLKKINDSSGHGVGDAYIKMNGSFFNNHLRRRGEAVGYDTVGRVGGDEFLMLADLSPREDEDKAPSWDLRKIAFEEWLRHEFTRQIKSDGQFVDSAGFSIGIARLTDYESIEEAQKAADEELYKQKEARGKVRKS